MRTDRRFLMSWIIFLFCTVVFPLSSAEENLPAIVKKIEPSTVVILTYNKEGKILGQGSGFFISENGDVITNRHMLQGASRAEVKITDERHFPITEVVAEDKEGDLIRVSVDIPRNSVHPLLVSDSLPEVGEKVLVIGSPLGLERTVTDGIVLAVRKIPGFGKIIQITAPISLGSSGSPVVNMKGEVIGVATFLILEGQNLNFAIPGERVLKLVPGKKQTLAEWKTKRDEEWLLSAEGLYSTGLTFLWIEDYKNALSYFEQALKKDPRYADACVNVGYCNGELGRYNEAIKAFKQAIRIKPDDADAHFNLGAIYGELGRYREAIEAYKQAVRIKPDDAEAHYNLGVTYGELGHHNEAIEAYKQAIRIKPDYAKAHCNLGVAYGELGRYSEEIEACKQAIRIKPDYADAHYNLGVAYVKLERHNEAIKAFKQAIRIKPYDAKAHYNLGVTYGELGRYSEEIEACKQAIRIKPDYADAHYNLGVAYVKLGRYNEAIGAFRQAIRIKPDAADAHCNLGVTYGILGRYNEAIKACKQAIRIKPDDAKAHYGLGMAYLMLGNKGSALDQYRILKDLNKDLANQLFDLIYK